MSEEASAKILTAKMWAKSGDAYLPCEEAVDRLKAGQYTIEISQERGIYFQEKTVNLDDLLTLPDSATESVLAEIEKFWGRESLYRQLRYLWKRGILLWGPPGSGKTSTVQLISRRIVERDGIAIYISNPKIAIQGLKYLRKIEPGRPAVVIIEDIDAIVSHHESEILALLDGELQVDNIVFVATTNYPEKLDRRLVNRPSRFDLVKKVPMPNPAARKAYLLSRAPELGTTMRKIDTDECTDYLNVMEAYARSRLKEVAESAAISARISGWSTRESNAVALEIKDKLVVPSSLEKDLKESASKIIDEILTIKDDVPSERELPEVDFWISKTEGFSVAHLKEVILGVLCFGQPLEHVVKRMRRMIDSKLTSSGGSAGFD